MLRAIKRLLIGQPMKTSELEQERLPIWKALPILSSDALSSVAYGTEAILGVLVTVSAAAMWYSLPMLVWMFSRIKQHYGQVAAELKLESKGVPTPSGNLVIIPISGITTVVNESIAYALSLTTPERTIAVYIGFDNESLHQMEEKWERWRPGVRLVTLRSQYRSIMKPLFRFINSAEARVSEHDFVTLLVPEFITRKWWHRALHNQTSLLIKAYALSHKDVVLIIVPYHLKH